MAETTALAHHCPDWDFAFIRPGDPEMECCLCHTDDELTRIEALSDEEVEAEATAQGFDMKAHADHWRAVFAQMCKEREDKLRPNAKPLAK